MKRTIHPLSIVVLLAAFLASCAGPVAEDIDLDALLPEGAMQEITFAHPNFSAQLVSESDIGVAFEDRFLVISGIEDEAALEQMTEYVLSYLVDPDKKANQSRAREEYQNLPPREKMDAFVERIRRRSPDFDYEWVGADEGNVDLVYGDNSLIISGVENEGAMQEIAHGLRNIQELIDAEATGEHE